MNAKDKNKATEIGRVNEGDGLGKVAEQVSLRGRHVSRARRR